MKLRVVLEGKTETEIADALRRLAKRVQAWGADHSPMSAGGQEPVQYRAAWDGWDDEDTANVDDFGM